jgi:hypothetical protein
MGVFLWIFARFRRWGYFCGFLQVLYSLFNCFICRLSESTVSVVGCALTFASEAKFEIEAKILFRLEAKKKPDFT